VAVVAGSMLSIGWVRGAAAQDEHVYSFEEIEGNRIAWSCEGSGEPTIALIAGSGLTAHESFGRIYHNYKSAGRICMYDRAGVGKSTFAHPDSRKLAQLAGELHELAAREKWGRLVLVAHSFGGLVARAYINQYPDDVLGILFLDSQHEDWLPRLKSEMSMADWAILEGVISWTLRTLHEDIYEAQDAVRTLAFPSALPVTVVSRGLPHTTVRVAGMSYDGVDLFNAEHDALQAKLLTLSSNTEHRVARYSSHMVNDTDPLLVIEEIGKLVERASGEKELR
jgi:pimeloyl-ACP methyl ester carboxylesterase